MDIGHLTDLLPYAFSLAANHGSALVAQTVQMTGDIWTAVSVHEAMPEGQRNFQLIKLAGSSIGLGISASAGSIEGIAGFAIGEGEALMELQKAGQQWRISHTPHTPPEIPIW